MAIVAPSAEGVVPSPPPVGTASAQSEMPDSLAPPPSVPHSLADTLPFVVDLENHAVSPHAHPPLTGDFQPPPLASPPPSPSFSVARPCLLHPSSPSVLGHLAHPRVHHRPLGPLCPLSPPQGPCLPRCLLPAPAGRTAPSLLPTDLGASAPW